jgi:CIC family chloride channel protein
MLDRWQPPESAVLGGLAILVGLLGSGGVWLFKRLIDLTQLLAFVSLGGMVGHFGQWTLAILPVLGGLLVGLTMSYLVGPERCRGVSGVVEASALHGGRLAYSQMPAKVLGAALAIGAGASVGPEDPSVQIGASLGSMFGQWSRFSDERVRALVASGAAAGIAAVFNAPIAGVFFALEIIFGELNGAAFGTIVLAALTSAIFTQAVSGTQPAFRVPVYPFRSGWELPLYLGLGLAAGPLAALYVRLVYLSQDLFQDHLALPAWLKPAVAGLAVGVVGVFLPQALGVGYGTISGLLNGGIAALQLVLALLIAKLILTPLSIGGGFPGGVIAPALFIGAALGSFYGAIASLAFPQMHITAPGYAMVGMAALLAGALHAPLTAITLVFEMTNDYRIILPLTVAVVASLAVSQRLQSYSAYSMALARRGIHLQRGRDVDVLDGIAVRDVLHPALDTLSVSDSLLAAGRTFQRTRHHGLPVLDRGGRLVGIFTLRDLDQALAEPGHESLTVGEACTRDLLVAYPEESIGTALRRMSGRDIGRLPVVERSDPHHMGGMLSRADVIHAYNAALTRRAQFRHRADEVRLATFGAARTEEFQVMPATPCAGKRMSEIPWPDDCIVATVRRQGQMIIPHGDTVLQPGDVLVAVLDEGARGRISALCSQAPGATP